MKAPVTIATGISVGKFSSIPGVGISLNLRPSITQSKASSFNPSRGELPGSGFINTKFSFRESLNRSLSRPTINTNKSIRPIIDISRPTQVNLTSADKQEARLATAQAQSSAILAVINFGNPVRLSERSRLTDGRTGVSRRSLLTANKRPSSLGVVGEINRINRINSPDIAISRKTPVLRRDVVKPNISKGLFSGVFIQSVDHLPRVLVPITRRSILVEQTKSPVIVATSSVTTEAVVKKVPPKVVSLPEVKVDQRAVGTHVLSPRISNDEEEKKRKDQIAQEAQRESIVAGLIKAFAPDIKVAKGLVQILKQTPELAPQAQRLAVSALMKASPQLLTLGKAQVEELVIESQTQTQGKGAKNGGVELAVSGAWGPVYGYVLAERTWAKRYLATAKGLEGLAVRNKTGKEFVDLLVLKYWLLQEQGLNSPIVEEGKDHAWNDTLEIIGRAGVQERFAAKRFVDLLNGWTKPVDYQESGPPVEEEHVLRLFNKVEYRKFMGWLKGVFGFVEDSAVELTRGLPVDSYAKVASRAIDSLAA